MAERQDPRIPRSANRQLRGYAQQLDRLRAEGMILRAEVVEEIETKEAELRALKHQLTEIDKTVQHKLLPVLDS